VEECLAGARKGVGQTDDRGGRSTEGRQIGREVSGQKKQMLAECRQRRSRGGTDGLAVILFTTLVAPSAPDSCCWWSVPHCPPRRGIVFGRQSQSPGATAVQPNGTRPGSSQPSVGSMSHPHTASSSSLPRSRLAWAEKAKEAAQARKHAFVVLSLRNTHITIQSPMCSSQSAGPAAGRCPRQPPPQCPSIPRPPLPSAIRAPPLPPRQT